MTAKLTRAATTTALGLLLAVIVGALAVLTVVPRAVNGAALTVLTGSMSPQIPAGSVVVVRPVDPGTLRSGDVITFQKAPGVADFVTHRILEIHPDTTPLSFTTKGDANRGEDVTPVPATAVRGKVLFHVPYLGTVRNTVSVGGSGLILLVLGLFTYAGAQVVSAVRDGRRTKTAEVPTPLSIAAAGTAGPALELQLLVVSLRNAEFEGLAPDLVARLLRMDLVDEGPDSFTLAVAREPEQLDTLVDLLGPFAPVHLDRSATLVVPARSNESARRATVLAVHDGAAHAA